MTAVDIRPYRERDAEAVVRMYAQAYESDRTLGKISASDWARYAAASDPASAFRLAWAGDHVAGLLTSSRRAEQGLRHIRIVVDPAERRRGIGDALLAAAAQLDGGALSLQTLCPGTWTAARAFYEHAGFRLVEEELSMRAEAPRVEARDVAGLLLRPAEDGDVAHLAALHNEAYEGTRSFVRYDDARMRAVLSDDDARVLVATRDGAIVGYCHYEPSGVTVHVESLVTAGATRRRGIGRRLMAASLADAARATLTVDADNEAAVGLYRALGFVESGRSFRYARPAEVRR